jgi:hypothetical protein
MKLKSTYLLILFSFLQLHIIYKVEVNLFAYLVFIIQQILFSFTLNFILYMKLKSMYLLILFHIFIFLLFLYKKSIILIRFLPFIYFFFLFFTFHSTSCIISNLFYLFPHPQIFMNNLIHFSTSSSRYNKMKIYISFCKYHTIISFSSHSHSQ